MTNRQKYELNPIKCNHCKSTIQYTKRPKQFCDMKCYGAHNSKCAVNEYYRSPLHCRECNAVIPFKKKKIVGNFKFCNNSCRSKYSVKHCPLSKKSRNQIIEKNKIIQKQIWNDEMRKIHSNKMKQVVAENPESYSTKNVCGRVKRISTIDSFGNKTSCLGKWELLVISFLNRNKIKWTNKIEKEFYYTWNGGIHRYFPDFYLSDFNFYIEVKGYERDRDRCKWQSFKEKLILIKKKEIQQIKEDSYALPI